ncbi:JAB domain-containing protein [Flavivirga amylovorans]|uniref:JAB domain-containing protein n=1 Tax=Flavivirga amylovorans TaxID=870486 RepID=A0ABT8WXB5_9FLAO|nr:JAB domain-containing protein [Flavivirga amylovorans]MDO5986137.1 JAB domain-containing protein [Flavivirga amylovorans]
MKSNSKKKKSKKNKINEIKVSYKEYIKASHWQKISSSKSAGRLLYEDWNKDTIELHENFKVVLLNNSNKVKGIYELSQGGITGTLIDLRILFAVVLKTLSVAIILCHNHPSGNLKPSVQDKYITNKIKKAAKMFDVKVLDHIIMAPNGDYFSFSDNELL